MDPLAGTPYMLLRNAIRPVTEPVRAVICNIPRTLLEHRILGIRITELRVMKEDRLVY